MEAEVSTTRRTLVHRLVPLAITPRRSPRLLAKRLANQHDKPDNQLSPRQVVPLPGVTVSWCNFEGRFLRSGAGFLCLTLASGTCRRHQRTRG